MHHNNIGLSYLKHWTLIRFQTGISTVDGFHILAISQEVLTSDLSLNLHSGFPIMTTYIRGHPQRLSHTVSVCFLSLFLHF